MATTTPAPPGAGPTETAVTMLTALGTALDGQSLRTRLITQAGAVPVLLVTNPRATQLSERICAAPLAGTWHYFWSWAEPIAPTPAGAATAIARVLRTAAPAGPGQP
jgi:hypothetical protein